MESGIHLRYFINISQISGVCLLVKSNAVLYAIQVYIEYTICTILDGIAIKPNESQTEC